MIKQECGCVEHNGKFYKVDTENTPAWTLEEIETFEKIKEEDDYINFENIDDCLNYLKSMREKK